MKFTFNNTRHIRFFLAIFLIFFAQAVSGKPRVTIITTFEVNDPISNFLSMLTDQDYFNECEIFFISSNSTTKELEIITEYQTIFFTIHSMVANNNDSISSLFNRALQQAQSDYITFMRIEDYRDPTIFMAQLETLEKNAEIDVVYSDYYTSYIPHVPACKADSWYLNVLPEFHVQWLYRDIPGPHATWRKSLHVTHGFFREDFHFGYLWEFWNRCAKKGTLFKKVHGEASTYQFNYFDQKKILKSAQDFEISYQEEKYIKKEYGSLWSSLSLEEKPFVIIIPSYKNKDWYKRNLDSIFEQNYSNYRIIYIDDNSPDHIGQLALDYSYLLNKSDKISVIINKENVGALANIYNAVHRCQPQEIVLLVDGDDWLAHNQVLAHLNTIYHDHNVWLTYGQFQWFPAQMPGFIFEMPQWVIEKNCIREYRWITTHLRTFYAGLFQKIKHEDFLYENKFYTMAWDLGIMYPMVEMAGYHTRFIPEILYIYNTANQINDNKVNLDLQGKIDTFIRKKERYSPINSFMG